MTFGFAKVIGNLAPFACASGNTVLKKPSCLVKIKNCRVPPSCHAMRNLRHGGLDEKEQRGKERKGRGEKER